MKIVIIKSFADDYDCDMLQSEQDINPLSYALTKRFLRKNGDLFQKLLGSFLLVPNIRIVLIADEGKDKEVLRLRLDIDRKDLWMAHEISNLQGMLQIMEGYFKQQGLSTIHPNTQSEIVEFLKWMRKELPIIDEYIEITT